MNRFSGFLTTKELAELLNASPRTVENWRRRKQGPSYIKLPTGRVRYSRESVLEYIKNICPQAPTRENAGQRREND